MNLIKEANYEIFDNYGMDGSLVKKAGECCYKHTSNKTIEDYMTMLVKNNHLAMTEFCWYVIEIPTSELTINDLVNTMHYYNSKKYLNCTSGNTGLMLSGNGRAWYEIFKNELSEYSNMSICYQLRQLNPMLFNFPCQKKIHINVLTKSEIQLKENNFNGVAKISNEKDRTKHDWIAVKFENVSRGFTHEIVRHRVMSFAQTSTRYVPMKNFGFVIDGIMLENSTDFKKIEDTINNVQETYNFLLNRGHKREVIRQLLPIGLASEIFVAGNLEEWKHLFELRTASSAAWEIKIVISDLKAELIEKGYGFL
jgi:hypothetical protein